jgi:hypothetical protein
VASIACVHTFQVSADVSFDAAAFLWLHRGLQSPVLRFRADDARSSPRVLKPHANHAGMVAWTESKLRHSAQPAALRLQHHRLGPPDPPLERR